ncbi:MAG TPA: hypothetical protein VFX59_02395 [Polyangiales bacterium]|nr:hypothetical protein [Polyangiales bacterium]
MDRPRGLGRLLVPIAALLFAATTVVKIGDADIFSHVAAGRWMLAHGQIPHTDPFSYASAGPWKYTEALAQVLFALVERAGGFAGVVWFNSALLLGLALIVGASCRARPSAVAVVICWLGAASYMALEPKPQTFSYLCFALLLWLLRAGHVQVVPVLFLAWGYLHRGGTLGLMVLLGSAALALVFERRHALLLVTLASALALALNPGGWFYFRSTFDVASRASFHAHIAEWQPLTWTGLVRDHATFVPLLACALFERVRTRQKPDFELVALALGLVAAMTGARLVPFAAIAAAPPAARGLDALVARLQVRPALMHAALATLALGSLASSALRVAPAFWGPGIIDTLVPVHLASVIRDVPARGHVFHSFDFGGYFLYALDRKVLIDGRNDTVYDDRFFLEVLRADTDPAQFAALDRKYHFDVAAVRWNAPNEPSLLARDPAWALLTWDDRGAVYVRRAAVDASYLSQHAYRELRVDDAFARAATPGPNDAVFLAELARNTREAPHSARAWLLATLAYRTRGMRSEYLATRARLVDQVNDRALTLPMP